MTCVAQLPEELTLQGGERLHYDRRYFQDLALLSDDGKPRLSRAIGYFNQEENDELLMDLYQFWRDYDEYMVLRRRHIDPRHYDITFEYSAVKCSKRGNDVHSKRVQKRLSWLNRVQNIEFFDVKDFSTCHKVKTSLLWITLTYDPGRCSRRAAWQNVGEEFSRFMHLVRKRYGQVSALRVWESFENGYPHVHVCLYFQQAKFQVFPWLSRKEGRFSFRIVEKAQFQEFWHSHVDVEAISSMHKLGSYIRKYQTKVYQGQGSKSLKTMAFCWIFRKRSFALSGSFREQLHDLILDLRNWAMEEGQATLTGGMLDEGAWEFVGVFPGELLRINGAIWFCHLGKDQVDIVLRAEHGFGTTNFD
jgi:hypothetical protein